MRNDQPDGPSRAEGSSFPKFEVRTVFIALRCWWKLALPAGLLLAAGAGSLVYYFFEPQYKAQAWLEIKESAEQIVASRTDDSRKFVDNQIELMRSPFLLGPLIARPDISSTPELAGGRDRYQSLNSRLSIKRQGESELLVLEFSSKSPQKAALIVNSVANAYLGYYKDHEGQRRKAREDALAGFSRTLADRLDKATQNAQIQAVDKGVQLNDPLFGDEKASKNPEAETLADIQSQLIHAEIDLKLMGADARALETALANAKVEFPDVDLLRALAEDEQLAKLAGELTAVKDELARFRKTGTEATLKRTGRFNELLARELEIPAEIEKLKQEKSDDMRSAYVKGVEAAQRAELDGLKRMMANQQLRRDQLKDLYLELARTQSTIRGNTIDLRLALAELDLVQKLHAEINSQWEALKLNNAHMTDRAKIWVLAEPPTLPDEEMPWKSIALFAGAAFCAPLALAIGWEHFFRRVNSREQLETAGALKVVGEITSLPRRTRRTAGASARVGRDLQLFEESIDGLRTYLSLVETHQGLRVLAVTSAVSREGKTSVAAQLAVSLAGATGERTLLIDADLRSPDVHRVFGVELSPGLAEVLAGELADDEVIETDFNETLHLMTAGRLTTSPHRLLGSGEFSALLQRLRGVYRYIVIDTPPLLPASESLILTRAADAAILSARRDFSRLAQVTEAYTRLRDAGVSFAGVVLNGIPTRNYAYKYGSYGYRKQLAEA